MSDRLAGLELIRIPSAVVGAFHDAIGAGRSRVEAAEVLRQAGMASGSAVYTIFEDWLSEAGSGARPPEGLEVQLFWERLADFFAQLGWGGLEYEQPHDGVIAITLRDWFEAVPAAAATGGCHFTTGLLAQILRRVADQDVAAMEVEFEAAESGRCRILFGSPAVMAAVYEQIEEGTTYGAALAAMV